MPAIVQAIVYKIIVNRKYFQNSYNPICGSVYAVLNRDDLTLTLILTAMTWLQIPLNYAERQCSHIRHSIKSIHDPNLKT